LAYFLRFGEIRQQSVCECLKAQILIKTDRSDKRVIKNVTTIYAGTLYLDKSITKPKFFLQISDHQQSVAPSRGPPHTPSSAGGR
jgi:hypothetical protein